MLFKKVDFKPLADTKKIEKLAFTSEAQREMWFACMIGGVDANLSYNESVSLEITGHLDVPAFKKALNNLVLRHEALRSTIGADGETLVIYNDCPLPLDIIDISRLNGSARKVLKNDIRAVINTPFDLQNGPLFKVLLHKLIGERHYFTIIKHHIIGDSWSTGVMLEDLSKMYNAYVNGVTIVLDKASQISDYALSEAGFGLTKEHKQTEEYWLNIYKDNVPVVDLPTDNPRRSKRTYKGNRIDHPLSNKLADQIKVLSAETGASLTTTLLAAFEVFLYQKTRKKDLVVGFPSSGQAASGLTRVVGHCVNLLPLKSQIDPDLSFIDYLEKRKAEVLDAYDHQRLIFGDLLRKIHIPKEVGRIPLVPVIFNVDLHNAVFFQGLDFTVVSHPREFEMFELYLNAISSKDGVVLEWSYNTGLFNADTIESFNTAYQLILEDIIANPAIHIAALTNVREQVVNINIH
jgi:hypothetical protein